MSKIQIPPKIRTEDFPPEMADTISKLGGIYNNFVDQVTQVLNGGIDYSNLKRQVISLDVTINAAGVLVNPPNIKYTLTGKVQGINVLSATNLVNSGIYPIAQPFVSFTVNGQFIVVLNVAGLQNSSQYRLVVEIIA